MALRIRIEEVNAGVVRLNVRHLTRFEMRSQLRDSAHRCTFADTYLVTSWTRPPRSLNAA